MSASSEYFRSLSMGHACPCRVSLYTYSGPYCFVFSYKSEVLEFTRWMTRGKIFNRVER
jgi:hypothetical protein